MEAIFIIGLIAFIRLVIVPFEKRRAAITTLGVQQPQSACITCAYAHIAQGVSERQKLVACTFGGSVRTLKFAVSTCTFYFNRAAIPRMVAVAGFAPPDEVELISSRNRSVPGDLTVDGLSAVQLGDWQTDGNRWWR